MLPNILDVPALYRTAESDTASYSYDVVFLGRLDFEKDPEKALRVFSLVAAKHPEATFAFIGDGPLMPVLKELCHRLALENSVSFLGFQKKPLKMLQDAKCMLMTSRWEGLPMSALEAMALGVPLVCTPTDGLNALITEGETGFLRRDEQELAACISALLDSPEKQLRMSDACKRHALVINDMDSYKKTLLLCYRQALKGEKN